MPSHDLLKQLQSLNRSSSAFHDQLSNILYGEDYKRCVPDLQGEDLVWLVDYLDETLNGLDPASSAFRKCLRELRHICGTKTKLPTSYTLSSSALNIGRQPVVSGGSGDIYKGTLNGSRICVKRVRIYSKDGPKKATRTLYQEAVVWKRLSHPNVVPLLGITPAPFQLISQWMPGGDLGEYVKKNPDADKLGLLSDVAGGLHFLHSCNIVHGDLKGPNILVDADGHARITDFGLATVTQNLDSIRSASDDHGHTARWTAPEILNEQGTYSKEADVFSFAMVMIEVYTGAVPFNHSLPAAAMLAIMNGTRPPRPTHSNFTGALWVLMQRCWDQDPLLRPEVSEVEKTIRSSEPPPIKPSIYKLPSASALTMGQQQLLAGYKSVGSHPPSLHNTVSSSSRRTPQISPQKSNYSTGPLSPDSQDGSVGLDEIEDAKPHVGSQAPIQDPPSEQQGGQLNGRVSWRSSRRDTAATELSSPLPIDPQGYNFSELQKGQAHGRPHGHLGGAENSRANLQNTLGRNTLRRNTNGKDPRDRYQGGRSRNPSRAFPSSDHPGWKRLISHTLATDERNSLITTIFLDRNQVKVVEHLAGDDAQTFTDMMDEALDSLPPRIRRRCLRSLYRVCGRQAVLPRSLVIPLCYNPSETPACHGGFGEVWKGRHDGREVAVKVLKVYATSDFEQIRKRFCREVTTWKALRHPNVLPLIGVTISETRFVMVSEWMVKGNINEFVKADTKADRLGFLREVTMGLSYMHGEGVVHGDLKGVYFQTRSHRPSRILSSFQANILISHDGHACLADFSLLTITSDQSTIISSCIEGGTIQWMSPELIDPENFGLEKIRPTKKSDCYALGMVIHEVLSGQAPFTPWKAPLVIRKVMNGERPERPQGERGALFTDGIWGILELCWKHKPDERPSAKAVLRRLEGIPSSRPSSPSADGDVETDSDGQLDAASSNSCLSITQGDNGLAVPPHNHPRNVTSVTVAPDRGQLLTTPRTGSPRGGWVDRLVYSARNMFKSASSKPHRS